MHIIAPVKNHHAKHQEMMIEAEPYLVAAII